MNREEYRNLEREYDQLHEKIIKKEVELEHLYKEQSEISDKLERVERSQIIEE